MNTFSEVMEEKSGSGPTHMDHSSVITQSDKLDRDKSSVGSENCIASDKSPNDNSRPAIEALLNKLPELDNCFNIHGKIGEGTFSNVYLASLKVLKSDKKFAIKHLIPTTHPRRMKYELDCLTRIGGKDNVVSCDMSLRKADCVVFIMPYLPHKKFADYVLEMNVEETRLYMKNLLLALRRVHSFHIIHRDVKPSNFLYNRDTKKFLLVDFGLAQKVNEQNENSQQKSHIPNKAVNKRKREDNDLENSDKPAVKRCALQTLSNDMVNKQDRPRSLATLRNPKQPLSVQQLKCQQAQKGYFKTLSENKVLKKQPLSSNASNFIEHNDNLKQEFQCLLPQKMPVESGASHVRVQNSQVQTGLFPKPVVPPVRQTSCDCNGKPQICLRCLTRKAQYAPRAGTPGFRPPEVLLKYPHQTTAVDMWAAGVIMMCIVSGCYPFFRSPDDITALSEFITVFGSSAIVGLAKKLGRNVICSENRKPLNIRILCENLRQRKLKAIDRNKQSSDPQPPPANLPVCGDCHHSSSPEFGCLCEDRTKLDLSKTYFPSSAYHLLSKLLDIDPDSRITAEMALEHPFITGAD